jgi:hypothetical protein
MAEQLDLWTAYNGTAGFVDRPASRERAYRELENDALSIRQQAVLAYLEDAGKQGMTWKQLSELLGLHHGQISGALSNMHKCGVVFSLVAQRDRCHPYVHAMYRESFSPAERYDKPARTRKNQRNDLLDELLDACRVASQNGWSTGMTSHINNIIATLDGHDNKSEKQT